MLGRCCGNSCMGHLCNASSRSQRASTTTCVHCSSMRQGELMQRSGSSTCIALLNSSVFCSLSLLLMLCVTAATRAYTSASLRPRTSSITAGTASCNSASALFIAATAAAADTSPGPFTILLQQHLLLLPLLF